METVTNGTTSAAVATSTVAPAATVLDLATARSAFAAKCLAMFDAVNAHVETMAMETRETFETLSEKIGQPRQRELTEKHATETEIVKSKDKDGKPVEKVRAKRVPKLDAAGNPETITVVDAPDFTLMVCEALATTGLVVVNEAGRTAGVWRGKVAKTTSPNVAAKELATVKATLSTAEEARAAAEAKSAELQKMLDDLRAKIGNGKKQGK